MGTELQITPLTEHVGALIEGFDARDALDVDTAAELRAAFDRHRLLVLRDQEVDVQQHIAFASTFGTVVDETHQGTYHGFVSNRRVDSATPLEAFLPWHSDYGWTPRPDSGLSLFGAEVVESLAPTCFVSNIRALAALPADLRSRVESMTGVMMVDLSAYGDVEPCAVQPTFDDSGEAIFPDDDYNYPRVSHPLVYRHPRTGEDLLFVQEWYSVLVEGLSYSESRAVHDALFAVLYDPAFVYSHEWRQGDLLVWDNLALQHGRPQLLSTDGGVRTLRRIVLHDAYGEVIAFSRRLSDLAAALQVKTM